MRKGIIRYFFIVILGFFVSIAGFYSYFSYKNIQPGDLEQIQGHLLSSEEVKIGRTYQYQIKLKEYPAIFTIWSVPLQAFDKKGFSEKILRENLANISVLKKDIDNLSKVDTKINIYELEIGKDNFLKISDINKELASNSKWGLLLGIIFLVLDLALALLFIFLVRK